jgi:ABC-2 type transport system ATP-binding protein
VLTADRLTRRFGPRVAVEELTLDLAPGEIVALLGPNGAGKTTTLRMLAGLIAPSSGTVRLDGVPVDRETAPRLRASVGFLTEAPGLWDRLTVRDNLLVYARLNGLPAPRRAVDAALDRFGVIGRANDRTAQLSKGLKQRVALARALLHRPAILLLDEPTSGLDPESARGVRDLILRLRDEGKAVLLSTHNLDEVDRMATRVTLLRTRLVASGTPDALRGQLFGARLRVNVRERTEHYAGLLRAAGLSVTVTDDGLSVVLSPGGPDTPAIVRMLVGAGAGIESVVREEPPLEDVYLRLMSDECGPDRDRMPETLQ